MRMLDRNLQLHLLTLPLQTSRHCLMVTKTTWREALNYGVCRNNPTIYESKYQSSSPPPQKTLAMPLASLLQAVNIDFALAFAQQYSILPSSVRQPKFEDSNLNMDRIYKLLVKRLDLDSLTINQCVDQENKYRRSVNQ